MSAPTCASPSWSSSTGAPTAGAARPIPYTSAVHAVELAYVFNNLDDTLYTGEIDPATAARVQESWVNFAKTGDPSIAGVTWKAYGDEPYHVW
ncbi:MAG: carboxylesterase family protein [Eggerthellaceae bacterium]|nr:carboxylesterase family protein [Eggerthellaceae bacterium]